MTVAHADAEGGAEAARLADRPGDRHGADRDLWEPSAAICASRWRMEPLEKRSSRASR